MPKVEMIILIDKDGQIEIEAVKYKGKICHSKLQEWLPVLGTLVSTKKKAEFYQDDKVRISAKAE